VLLIIPLTPILGCIGFAIRTGLAGGDATAIERDLILGGLFSFIISALIGALYLFTGGRKRWNIKWRTILTTVYLTAAVSALLYAIINVDMFRWLVPTVANEIVINTTRRAVLGALDGCGYGLAIGAFISLFDPRATRLTRSGIIHYTVVYVVLFTGNILIMLVELSGETGDSIANVLLGIFMFVMKSGIHLWNKHHPEVL
jgi:hypothetical protein